MDVVLTEDHVARLVLAYLKEENCHAAYHKFLHSSPHLKKHISNKRHIRTRFLGENLAGILQDYVKSYTLVQDRIEATDFFQENNPSLKLSNQLAYLIEKNFFEPANSPFNESRCSTPVKGRESVCNFPIVPSTNTTSLNSLPGNSSKETLKKTSTVLQERSWRSSNVIDEEEESETLTDNEAGNVPDKDTSALAVQAFVSRLLDQEELREKIAENINTAIHFENNDQNEFYQGLEEVDGAIKAVLEKTHSDPAFESLLVDVVGSILPAEDIHSSDENNIAHNQENKRPEVKQLPPENCTRNVSSSIFIPPVEFYPQNQQLLSVNTAGDYIVLDGQSSVQSPTNYYANTVPNTQNLLMMRPPVDNKELNDAQPGSYWVISNSQVLQSIPQQSFVLNSVITEQEIMKMPTIIIGDELKENATKSLPMAPKIVEEKPTSLSDYITLYKATDDSPVGKGRKQQATSPEKKQQATSIEKKTQATSPEKKQQATSPEKKQQATSTEKKQQATSPEKKQQATSTEKKRPTTLPESKQPTTSSGKKRSANLHERTRPATRSVTKNEIMRQKQPLKTCIKIELYDESKNKLNEKITELKDDVSSTNEERIINITPEKTIPVKSQTPSSSSSNRSHVRALDFNFHSPTKKIIPVKKVAPKSKKSSKSLFESPTKMSVKNKLEDKKSWDSHLRVLTPNAPSGRRLPRKPAKKSRKRMNQSTDLEKNKKMKLEEVKVVTDVVNERVDSKQETIETKLEVCDTLPTVNKKVVEEPKIKISNTKPNYKTKCNIDNNYAKIDVKVTKMKEDKIVDLVPDSPDQDKLILSPSKLHANKRSLVSTNEQTIFNESLNENSLMKHGFLLLETPIKELIPKTPGFFSPVNTHDTPNTKTIKEQLCGIDLTTIPTPKFPITPNFPFTPLLTEGQSPFSNRPTDYSTSSSYYQPSDSENKSLEQILAEESKQIEQSLCTDITKSIIPNKEIEVVTENKVEIFNPVFAEKIKSLKSNVIGKKNLMLLRKKKADSSSDDSESESFTDDSSSSSWNEFTINEERQCHYPLRSTTNIQANTIEVDPIKQIVSDIKYKPTLIDKEAPRELSKQEKILKEMEEKRKRTIKIIDGEKLKTKGKMINKKMDSKKNKEVSKNRTITKTEENSNKKSELKRSFEPDPDLNNMSQAQDEITDDVIQYNDTRTKSNIVSKSKIPRKLPNIIDKTDKDKKIKFDDNERIENSNSNINTDKIEDIINVSNENITNKLSSTEDHDYKLPNQKMNKSNKMPESKNPSSTVKSDNKQLADTYVPKKQFSGRNLEIKATNLPTEEGTKTAPIENQIISTESNKSLVDQDKHLHDSKGRNKKYDSKKSHLTKDSKSTSAPEIKNQNVSGDSNKSLVGQDKYSRGSKERMKKNESKKSYHNEEETKNISDPIENKIKSVDSNKSAVGHDKYLHSKKDKKKKEKSYPIEEETKNITVPFVNQTLPDDLNKSLVEQDNYSRGSKENIKKNDSKKFYPSEEEIKNISDPIENQIISVDSNKSAVEHDKYLHSKKEKKKKEKSYPEEETRNITVPFVNKIIPADLNKSLVEQDNYSRGSKEKIKKNESKKSYHSEEEIKNIKNPNENQFISADSNKPSLGHDKYLQRNKERNYSKGSKKSYPIEEEVKNIINNPIKNKIKLADSNKSSVGHDKYLHSNKERNNKKASKKYKPTDEKTKNISAPVESQIMSSDSNKSLLRPVRDTHDIKDVNDSKKLITTEESKNFSDVKNNIEFSEKNFSIKESDKSYTKSNENMKAVLRNPCDKSKADLDKLNPNLASKKLSFDSTLNSLDSSQHNEHTKKRLLNSDLDNYKIPNKKTKEKANAKKSKSLKIKELEKETVTDKSQSKHYKELEKEYILKKDDSKIKDCNSSDELNYQSFQTMDANKKLETNSESAIYSSHTEQMVKEMKQWGLNLVPIKNIKNEQKKIGELEAEVKTQNINKSSKNQNDHLETITAQDKENKNRKISEIELETVKAREDSDRKGSESKYPSPDFTKLQNKSFETNNSDQNNLRTEDDLSTITNAESKLNIIKIPNSELELCQEEESIKSKILDSDNDLVSKNEDKSLKTKIQNVSGTKLLENVKCEVKLSKTKFTNRKILEAECEPIIKSETEDLKIRNPEISGNEYEILKIAQDMELETKNNQKPSKTEYDTMKIQTTEKKSIKSRSKTQKNFEIEAESLKSKCLKELENTKSKSRSNIQNSSGTEFDSLEICKGEYKLVDAKSKNQNNFENAIFDISSSKTENETKNFKSLHSTAEIKNETLKMNIQKSSGNISKSKSNKSIIKHTEESNRTKLTERTEVDLSTTNEYNFKDNVMDLSIKKLTNSKSQSKQSHENEPTTPKTIPATEHDCDFHDTIITFNIKKCTDTYNFVYDDSIVSIAKRTSNVGKFNKRISARVFVSELNRDVFKTLKLSDFESLLDIESKITNIPPKKVIILENVLINKKISKDISTNSPLEDLYEIKTVQQSGRVLRSSERRKVIEEKNSKLDSSNKNIDSKKDNDYGDDDDLMNVALGMDTLIKGVKRKNEEEDTRISQRLKADSSGLKSLSNTNMEHFLNYIHNKKS